MCTYKYKSPSRKDEICKYNKYGNSELTTTSYRGVQYCIFHNPSTSKSPDKFWTALNKLIKDSIENKDENIDFEGFVFPKGMFIGRIPEGYVVDPVQLGYDQHVQLPENTTINFTYSIFLDDVRFFGPYFNNEFNFTFAEFKSNGRFWNTHFVRDVEFHKTTFKGNADFGGTHFYKQAKFNGAVFEKATMFHKSEFYESAEFRVVEISGLANFSNAIFSKKVDFTMAKFLGGADFVGSHFNNIAKFKDSEFEGEYSHFSNCIFKNSAIFTDSKFKSRKISFAVIRSFNRLNFVNVQFYSDVYFQYSKLYAGINLNHAIFHNKVTFVNSKIRSVCRFNAAVFNGVADFTSATFIQKNRESEETVYFSGATFNNRALFWETKCSIIMKFNLAKFTSTSNFINSWFKGHLELNSASFHSQADFQGSRITTVDFTGASFSVPPYLGDIGAGSSEIILKNFVSDGIIQFTKGLESTKNKTEEPFELLVQGGNLKGIFSVKAPLASIKLENTTLTNTITIMPLKTDKLPSFTAINSNLIGDTLLSGVKIKVLINCVLGSDFRIIDAGLSRTRFSNVDLSRIDFSTIVDWAIIYRKRSALYLIPAKILLWFPLRKVRKWLRNIEDSILSSNCVRAKKIYRFILFRKTRDLFDEVNICDVREFDNSFIAPDLTNVNVKKTKALEEKYRQIASSYESRRRYDDGGSFKAGEFEIRRQRSHWIKRGYLGIERCILTPYRWASFYGEDMIKPLFIILFIIIVPAFIYFFTGIPEPISDNGKTLYLHTSYTPDFSLEGIRNLPVALFGFGKSLILSLEASFPLKSSKVEAIQGWASFLPTIQRALTAIFAAFFAFALRRKARR